ncbi:TetR/AcrR family transcriptional regulator [Clostridium tyrobutyricum]|uniref:TetR/AcrR family transcriptional regulator n=1 Tax=Clostridium tyrobutyricum TaxID=1519 RepID=UPI001C38EA1F|nr:TetR/AcrR family transcriptional regulator [Clostridium tyrobutyricum]MBV4418899.1 TetR/AcrR family transcriptional regulator [Clostridium tyrobutyricum]
MNKKESIFNAGRELFLSKGFKNTNVSDITKLVGLGVGTFYNYYSSKEKLFFEVFIEESNKHKKYVMEHIDLNQNPVTAAMNLIAENVRAMKSNQILAEWNNHELTAELEKYYSEENKKNGDFFYDFYIGILKKWKQEGKIRSDIDDDIIIELFGILEYVDTHKDKIGICHFPEVAGYLAEFIMKGLTDCPK